MLEEFLQQTYFQNTIQSYLIALGSILLGLLLIKLVGIVIIRRLKKLALKTENEYDDFFIEQIEKVGLPIARVSLVYFSLTFLVFPDRVHTLIYAIFLVAVLFYVIKFFSVSVQFFLLGYLNTRSESVTKTSEGEVKGIMILVNIVLWSLGIFFYLDNLDFDVTAIATGLGVGGIAIALATQNIFGDLFNYLVIFFDRPFEIGDFIILDDKMGSVEYIGVKTTRVRSLTGEQLVLSNSDLTQSRLHNYKRMQRRRIAFTIGVEYSTKYDQLKEIPSVIKNIVDDQEGATFDRAHFLKYGDFSLNFEIVYYVESADFTFYADVQQSINLKLFEAFEQRGINFAFPTQTIFLSKTPGEDNLKPDT